MAHGALKISCETQENIPEEQMAKLMSLHSKLCWMVLAPEQNPIQPTDLLELPKLAVEDGEKTPSQRYRAAMYVWWQQTKPTKTFSEFYDRHYERLLQAVKEKLN